MMLLCDNCIEALRSRGEIVGIMEAYKVAAEDCEEYGCTCEWCGEIDDLHNCEVRGELY